MFYSCIMNDLLLHLLVHLLKNYTGIYSLKSEAEKHEIWEIMQVFFCETSDFYLVWRCYV